MADKRKPTRAEALWGALQKTPDKPATPASMVRDLYGLTRRGTPDTRTAARQLGVSQRTVQRWIKQGMPRRSAAAGRPPGCTGARSSAAAGTTCGPTSTPPAGGAPNSSTPPRGATTR